MEKDDYIKLGQLKGKVEYGYLLSRFDDEVEDQEKINYHLEPFYSLGDTLTLVSERYQEKTRKEFLADRIWVSSISFNSLSINKDMDVELILMKDEFFGQIIKSPQDPDIKELDE